MRVKMSKQPPPAPTASAVGPCPTVIKIVGRPGTGSSPSIIAPPDHPLANSLFGPQSFSDEQMATRASVCSALLKRFRSKDDFPLRLVTVDESGAGE